MSNILARAAFGFALFTGPLAVSANAIAAAPVQRVVSPGGIEAWLMESHEVGLISMKFSFDGGALEEPRDKPGVSYVTAYLFNEGAGDMDAAQLTRARQRIGVNMAADGGVNRIFVSFSTPAAHRTEAFDLLRRTIHQPRFDADAIARARGQAEAKLTAELMDPSSILTNQFARKLLGDTRYAFAVEGTLESLPRITVDDADAFRRRMFARSNLKIAVAGDIDAEELRPLLDTLFAALPANAELGPKPTLPAQATFTELKRMEIPQTAVLIGNLVPRLAWRQAIAADIGNYILSGTFTGRLSLEVREKRGLVYSIQSGRIDTDEFSIFNAAFGAGAENVGPALDVTRAEVARFLAGGPTEEEVRTVKDAFIGGFYLALDTNDKLANLLLTMQHDNLPVTYLDDFAAEVERISTSDVHTAMKLLIRPGIMTTVVVGNPDAGFQLENTTSATSAN